MLSVCIYYTAFIFGALLVIIIHYLIVDINTMHIMVCLVVVNDLKYQNSSKNVTERIICKLC